MLQYYRFKRTHSSGLLQGEGVAPGVHKGAKGAREKEGRGAVQNGIDEA